MPQLGRICSRIGDKAGPVGHAVAAVAAGQHGVISIAQLMELGLSRHAVASWVLRGWLHRVHEGVYAVGHPSLTPKGVLMAAQLAYEPEGVLAFRSALVIWDYRHSAAAFPDVIVPRSREKREGIRIHRPRNLEPQDVTTHDGFRVTTLNRTIFDMAGELSFQRLEDLWDQAERRGELDVQRLIELCGKGKKGSKKLRRLIAAATTPEPDRSAFERLFNVAIEGEDVDAYWERTNTIVELDSWEFHKTRRAFERDRAKWAKLTAAGYNVIPMTWRQMQGDEAWVRLRRTLRR